MSKVYTFEQNRANAPSIVAESLFENQLNYQLSSANLSSCPNKSPVFKFYNTSNGNELPLNCNRYDCPFCGPRKIKRLYKALNNYFSQFKYIRMWTFTLSSRVSPSAYLHYKLFSECWRRFIIELRRNPLFSEKQHKFQYVRVCEPHKSGYFHYHVLFTEYFERHSVQKIWDHICMKVTNDKFHVATASVKGILNSKSACKYICKYVSKSAILLGRYQKKWSKSSGPSIFPKLKSSGEWALLRIDSEWSDYFVKNIVFDYLTCKDIESTSQDLQGLSPPIVEIENLFSISDVSGIDFSENVPVDLVVLGHQTEIENFKECFEYFSICSLTN